VILLDPMMKSTKQSIRRLAEAYQHSRRLGLSRDTLDTAEDDPSAQKRRLASQDDRPAGIVLDGDISVVALGDWLGISISGPPARLDVEHLQC
jgi:hypothetical protein